MRNTADVLRDVDRGSLEYEGFLVLPHVLEADEIAAMRAGIDEMFEEGRGEVAFRDRGHLDLLDHAGPVFEPARSSPRVLAAVGAVLGPDFALGRLHFRGPGPGGGAQYLHADTSSTSGGRPSAVTVILALVPFTPANGATRVVPGSHRMPLAYEMTQRWSQRAVKRGRVRQDAPHRDQRVLTCPAGSAIVFSEQLWHSGTRNTSSERRDAFQITYIRGS